MTRSRLGTGAAVLLASLALTGVATAKTPAHGSLVVSRLTLDAQARGSAPHTPPVATRRLPKGKLFVATVQGTVSYYAAIDYLAPQAPFTAFCGRPLAAPQFASAGGVGMVGNDAQFIFAQPIETGSCATGALPRAWLNFQADDGFGWAHPRLLSARPLTAPLPSHTYSYAFVGQNRPLRFELDDPDTNDDYGSLHILVRRAVRSDCAGGRWRAFAVKTRNVCLGSTAHTHGSIPRTPRAAALRLSQAPVARVARTSDFPTAHDLEVPSGALTPAQFAGVVKRAPAAARHWAAQLTAAGMRSGAVSQFDGLGVPDVVSSAILTRTADGARRILADEVLQAVDSPLAGDTASSATMADGSTLITFTPITPGAAGGVEVLTTAGTWTCALQELQTPASAVSATAAEGLEATVAAR